MRISETEQMDLMTAMCKGKGNTSEYYSDHPDCWIGLKYSPDTTLFEWENGQSLDPPTNPNGQSQTGWRPGTNTPTAFTFLSGETTFCVAIAALGDDAFWDNVDCVFYAPTFPIQATLCNNPDYIWTPTASPTSAPTQEPTPAPTLSPTLTPSSSPTSVPSDVPTLSPSVEPTLGPSVLPTVSPSMEPTLSPSTVPSVEPTGEP